MRERETERERLSALFDYFWVENMPQKYRSEYSVE